MTKQEACALAFLRVRHNYSFALLSQAARAIWGSGWVDARSQRKGDDQIKGQGLVIAMEDTLGLETCESDDCSLDQCHCKSCQKTDFYLTSKNDGPKQCFHCGEMTAFLLC